MTAITWRTGRKVGRTIYEQVGIEPSDDDRLIGIMDTPDLARRAVEAVNLNGSRPPIDVFLPCDLCGKPMSEHGALAECYPPDSGRTSSG